MTCDHKWRPTSRTDFAVCDVCSSVQSVESIQNARTQSTVDAALRGLFDPQGMRNANRPRSHKPSYTCAAEGCERCIAEGKRLDAQLAQHSVRVE
jgi:hypothetical protein